jgi:hypothetical protein
LTLKATIFTGWLSLEALQNSEALEVV